MWLSYYKIPFRHLMSTVSHCCVATLMVTKYNFLQRCSSPQFHNFESLVSFHKQADYGSELGGYYHNTICKPDLIHISQESSHITALLEQYLLCLAL